MPMTPGVQKLLFESFFGNYGNDQRASGAVNEINQSFDANSAFGSTQKNLGFLQDLLSKNVSTGLDPMYKERVKKNMLSNVKQTTNRRVKDIRQSLDPSIAKTLGGAAYSDAYADEARTTAGISSDLDSRFYEMDIQYKNQAIAQLLGLEGVRQNALSSDRGYELNLAQLFEGKRQFDSEMDAAGEFDWNSLISGIAGIGTAALLGPAGGAAALGGMLGFNNQKEKP